MNFSYIDSTFGMWSPFQPLIQRIISSLSPFLTLSISLSLSLCLLLILPVSRLLSLLATLCSLLFYITHCMLSLSLFFSVFSFFLIRPESIASHRSCRCALITLELATRPHTRSPCLRNCTSTFISCGWLKRPSQIFLKASGYD